GAAAPAAARNGRAMESRRVDGSRRTGIAGVRRPCYPTTMSGRVALLVAMLAAVACTSTPYTHRSQLMLVSPEKENERGVTAYREVLSKSRVDEREAVAGPVQSLGQRLARVADKPDYRWEFSVIDDQKQVNAFCLPGGKVAVYTGIFPFAQTTHGLAVVL